MRAFGIALAAALLASVTTFSLTQAVAFDEPVGLSSAIAADSPQIRACANRDTGALRLLVEGRCTKRERLIVWSQEGPVGPTGVAGSAGSRGPIGPQGPAGPQGPGVIVTDGNGNRVTGVVEVFHNEGRLTRVLDGFLWDFSQPSGTLRNHASGIFYLQVGCTGQAYAAILPASGIPPQRVYFSESGDPFVRDPDLANVTPLGTDTVYKSTGSGCNGSHDWAYWREELTVYLMPLEPLVSGLPANLTGPLTLSAQN
jgi:hypothetical protein